MRVDVAIKALYPVKSRTYIQKLIKGGYVTIDGHLVTDPSTKVNNLQNIKVLEDVFIESCNVTPQNIDLSVIYEDSEILIINKQPGIIVHPGGKNKDNTIANGIVYRYMDRIDYSSSRTGIVHRLDKNTSGIMVIALSRDAHYNLSSQFAERCVTKKYIAICDGIVTPPHGTITFPIRRCHKNNLKMVVDHTRGKHSITHYKVLQYFSDFSLVECSIETGRTHQIRLHMSHMGYPIVQDDVYGRILKNDLNRQALHSYYISFMHPRTNLFIEFYSEIPEDMKNFMLLMNPLKGI